MAGEWATQPKVGQMDRRAGARRPGGVSVLFAGLAVRTHRRGTKFPGFERLLKSCALCSA